CPAEKSRMPIVAASNVDEVLPILTQPFFFLGKGKQSFSFESADGQYVLKFLKKKELKAKDTVTILPDFFLTEKWKAKKAKLKQKREKRLIDSFVIAAGKAPQECGFVFYHFGKTTDILPCVTLLDKRGKVAYVELDNVMFAVQKKALFLKPILMGLMAEGKFEQAKERLHEMMQLLVTIAKKGIVDDDGALI